MFFNVACWRSRVCTRKTLMTFRILNERNITENLYDSTHTVVLCTSFCCFCFFFIFKNELRHKTKKQKKLLINANVISRSFVRNSRNAFNYGQRQKVCIAERKLYENYGVRRRWYVAGTSLNKLRTRNSNSCY